MIYFPILKGLWSLRGQELLHNEATTLLVQKLLKNISTDGIALRDALKGSLNTDCPPSVGSNISGKWYQLM